MPLALPIMRTWSSPFGPLGTPLLDRDDPHGVVEDFLQMLSRPHLRLPKVLVLPDMHLDGRRGAHAEPASPPARGLPIETTGILERPFLDSRDGRPRLSAQDSLRSHHLREFRRMKRRLAEKGRWNTRVARSADDIRNGVESFLTLEASGWKGRQRTAMAVDRYRAAFAREAVHRLAEQDMCRVHSLTLDGEVIASAHRLRRGGRRLYVEDGL